MKQDPALTIRHQRLCRLCLTALAGVVLLAGCGRDRPAAAEPTSRSTGKPADTPIADEYRATANRIREAAFAGNDGWNKLEHLCLNIGNRLSGSTSLERAVDWAVATLQHDGQENVRSEPVTVPHWVRGDESITLVEPRPMNLPMLGLGNSVGTPTRGITAQVIVVDDEDGLNTAGSAVRGKIVLFNKVMPPYSEDGGTKYGETVKYRVHGPRLAAAKGAIACLVRSVTACSLQSPHTGSTVYGDAPVKIPAAAITLEAADMFARWQAQGKDIVVTLKMEAHNLPEAESANVMGEIVGWEKPEEIVVISGHLDSWDVGQGAHDDGAGCVHAMEALNVLRKLDLRPRRTIRVVLWTNEENGLRGAKQYAKDHLHEMKNHVAGIETDIGCFLPTGYTVDAKNEDAESLAVRQMKDIVTLCDPIAPMKAGAGWGGADVGPMKPHGVIIMSHGVDVSTYFNFHHTRADTLDKIDATHLTQNIATLATVAFVIADMPTRLGT